MTLCALTFSNTTFIEEALKYLLWIAALLDPAKPVEC